MRKFTYEKYPDTDLEMVTSISEISDNITKFNECITQSEGIQKELSMFKHWYFSKSLELFGPSKFIGYKKMSCVRFLNLNRKGMDGRDTEYIFRTKFKFTHKLDGPSSALIKFLNRFNKEPNKKTTITEID